MRNQPPTTPAGFGTTAAEAFLATPGAHGHGHPSTAVARLGCANGVGTARLSAAAAERALEVTAGDAGKRRFGCDRRRLFTGLTLALALEPAVAAAAADPAPAAAPGEPLLEPTRPGDLAWRKLMAPGWDSARYFGSLPAAQVASLTDEDPRARVLLAQLRRLGDEAPPAPALHAGAVRIAGFALPWPQEEASDPRRVVFVPFLDGCIHRPPPPANQRIHATGMQPLPRAMLPYRLWLQGTLEVAPADTPHGRAAYRVRDARFARVDERSNLHHLFSRSAF